MKKKSVVIVFIILFQLTLIGCKNTLQKTNDFVNSYNNSTQYFANNISSTSAKLIENNNVEIRFDIDTEFNENNKAIYSQIAPNLMTNLITRNDASKELIEEGVVFFVEIYASNNQKIASVEVDKKKLDEILKTQKPVQNNTNSAYSKSSELSEMLTIMNQSLPIENKAEGTKITKISIDESNILTYNVEVKDEIAGLINNEDVKNIMKESILRSSEFRTLVQGMRGYEIYKIRYIYQDSKGKKITELDLSSADLR